MSTESLLTTILIGLVPVFVILLGGAGWWIRHERERREATEHQLSEKKYAAYTTLINIFFDVLKASKTGKVPNDLSARMVDANRDLLIFGSNEVFIGYQTWTRSSSEGPKAMLHRFGSVILAIRKDMGHPPTRLTSDDVLRSFITDFD